MLFIKYLIYSAYDVKDVQSEASYAKKNHHFTETKPNLTVNGEYQKEIIPLYSVISTISPASSMVDITEYTDAILILFTVTSCSTPPVLVFAFVAVWTQRQFFTSFFLQPSYFTSSTDLPEDLDQFIKASNKVWSSTVSSQETITFFVSRLASTFSTPSILVSIRVTAPEQPPHVMPTLKCTSFMTQKWPESSGMPQFNNSMRSDQQGDTFIPFVSAIVSPKTLHIFDAVCRSFFALVQCRFPSWTQLFKVTVLWSFKKKL